MKALYLGLMPLVLTACGGGSSVNSDPASTAAFQQLAAKVSNLEGKVRMLEGKLLLASLNGPQESALFDPQGQSGYQPIKAPAGVILMSLEKVEPYLDGFIVTMNIGNPSSASYTGLKGTIKWGRTFDLAKGDEHNKLLEKEFDVPDQIQSGAWNLVRLNIAPAKAEDVRRIIVEPNFSRLNLRSAR